MNASPETRPHPAEKGARHWWHQRVSALILIPFTLWFVFAILEHIGDGQRAAAAWIADPRVAVALIAYLIVLFFHAQLGLQVIIEDYVSVPARRRKALLAMKMVNGLACLAAVFSVLRVVAGG